MPFVILTYFTPSCVCVQIRSFQKSIQSLSHVLIVLTHLNTSPPESLPRQNGPSLPALLANFNDSQSCVPAPLARSVCPFMSKEEFFVVWPLCVPARGKDTRVRRWQNYAKSSQTPFLSLSLSPSFFHTLQSIDGASTIICNIHIAKGLFKSDI